MAKQQPHKPAKPTPLGIVFPEPTYTLERLAITLGLTPRYVREEWVKTGELDAMDVGRSFLIPGVCFNTMVLRRVKNRRDDDKT